MEPPKAYDPKQIEEKIYELWEKSGFFNPDKLSKGRKKPFSIVIPPPNITGSLHMGHALNTIIQDILIRQKRMQGFKTLWLPGTDHAGIATQNVVEKELRKEGVSRHDLGREKFTERVWQWKEKYGNIILDQLKKLGASCDWSRTRFTMDKEYQKAVKEAFLRHCEKGWIYRGEKVVNWCARCQTSLSDLELEYREEKANLYWIKYGPFVLATTRPETKLGDTAVAVHPNDKRYKDMVGKKYDIPGVLGKFQIKVVADRMVDPEFGSGAVKVTPAHSIVDGEIAERHNLPSKKIIDERGRMMENCGKYAGLKTDEARRQIVSDMEKMGLIDHIDENYVHNIALCYRCGNIVENLPSVQWFLKMKELAKMAAKEVKNGKVKFIPKKWEKLYFDWLKNIKDWCISRQIWWGHQLPAWFCQTGRISNFQFPISKQNLKFKIKNSSAENFFIISGEKPKQCPFCKNCEMEQSADVLDTWFSSALWPFAALGWPQQKIKNQKSKIKNDLKRFYPTDVLVTARDIINLWVARMIFSGLEFMKKKPFGDIYIHATILTKEGKRMSKSLGTGVDPLGLIEKYGADAARFGIIWQETGAQDIHFGEEAITAGKKFCNKLWNASRFVLTQIGNKQFNNPTIKQSSNLTLADKKILGELGKIVKSVNKDLANYRFGRALRSVYDFFWHQFCDYYIEESKKQNDEKTQKILLYALLTSLKLLHPFIPFITEEIYRKLPIENKKKCLMVEKWPASRRPL